LTLGLKCTLKRILQHAFGGVKLKNLNNYVVKIKKDPRLLVGYLAILGLKDQVALERSIFLVRCG
tara:strand:- start:485 stop:679 length:195 start_codon:yes stop_codon:yes gene_type:complete